MRKKLGRRLAGFGTMGQAGLELIKAEGAALSSELKGSGQALARALLLIALGLFGFFWALGLVAFVSVEVLTQWMPRWAAATVILTALLVLSACVAWIGWRRIKRLDTPVKTVRRRFDEHQAWWQHRFGPVGKSESKPTDEPR